MTPQAKDRPAILVVEDHQTMAESICDHLSELGEVDLCTDGDSAIGRLLERPHTYSIVVLDREIPSRKGAKEEFLDLQMLNAYQLLSPGTLAIVFTAHASFRSCVDAVQAGAYDYIGKSDPEGGVQTLFRVCKRILFPEPDELDAWMAEKADVLKVQFGGRYITLLERETVQRAGCTDLPKVDPYYILAAAGIEELRRIMLDNPILRWVRRPKIMRIPMNTT